MFTSINRPKMLINVNTFPLSNESQKLHLPSVNLTKCKEGVYYMDIEIFNHLPRDIRVLLYDVNKFKLVTKNFF
jgi:hypothetical protein